ncbi:MAG: hypothetical protein PHY23_10355 [Oscillospiraceae bacterium]|nr:hypothetical protein [Oscillospiraceae bacterium]
MKHKKWLVSAVLALILVALAGCGGSPQKDAAQKYEDMVTLELFEVESGIAYYNAYISSDFGWDTAGPTRQCTVAKMAGDESSALLAAKTDFPLGAEAQEISVMGYHGDGFLAFSWNGGSSVKIYTDQSRENKIYKFADILD